MKKLYDSIIFDVDGTLWDATETMVGAYSAASEEMSCKYREKGIKLEPKTFTGEAIRRELGQPTIEIFHHLYPELEDLFASAYGTDGPCGACRTAESDERAETARKDIMDVSIVYEYDYLRRYGCRLYDGLRETLEALGREYPLFIVSNCEKGYIELFTGFSGTGELFTDWLCYGDTLEEKDRTIRIMMDRHRLEKPVYVGDILKDALSSRRAGVGFIWASYGFGEVPPELYDNRIGTFADLYALLC